MSFEVEPVKREVVLLVGAGGIAAPAAIALIEGGIRRFIVCDDDRVESTNLHRQILFDASDVGKDKVTTFTDALRKRHPEVEAASVHTRVLPENALELIERATIVLDATDNFASRFLLADACHLAGKPVVHAASVRWQATAVASPASGGPCYRCLFEDLPDGDAPDCATAGVLGPVCGVAGALGADLVLRALGVSGAEATSVSPFGRVFTYDGLTDRLRSFAFTARADCELCSPRGTLRSLDETRYQAQACDH